MSIYRLAEEFAAAAEDSATVAELYSLLEAVSGELGFGKVALVHSLWFRCPNRRLIRVDNFGEWANIFIERNYYLHDPGLLACQRTSAPFAWHQIPDLLPLTRLQSGILAEAQHHGLRCGFTVPIGVAGEPMGCCSFATNASELPSRRHRRAATLIAIDAFREARRLLGYPQTLAAPPALSRRKLECLRYLSCGKTDGEIATILGLKEPTVRTYMTLLRRDFDVVSRAQLAANALRYGYISYDDAIPAS